MKLEGKPNFKEMFNLIKQIFQRKFFTYSELMCKCGCEQLNLDETFAKRFLLFRVIYDKPFTPNSVYRCKNHKNYSSNHNGHAADIPYDKNNSAQRMKIIKAAIYAGFDRIGVSDTFIHIDCNPEYNGTSNEEVLWIYPKAKL